MYSHFTLSRFTRAYTKVYVPRDILAQENGAAALFSSGRRAVLTVRAAPSLLSLPRPFACARTLPFVRSPPCLRSFGFSLVTGTRHSDSHRALVRVGRAARDLAYFFHNLPYRRISWAIPYLPGGLTNEF